MREISKNLGYNLERVFHLLFGGALILFGIFNKDMISLAFIGFFIWGIIVGGVDK